MGRRTSFLSMILNSLATTCVILFPAEVFSQDAYYKGKTITILRGGEPSGDFQARALIPSLKKYIPGDPTIIVDNMPGAAGRKAANYIYATAKPDGLTIGAVGAGLVVGPILGLPGTQYDLPKFIYLGSTESGDPYVFLSRKEAGLESLDKLRAAAGLRIGAQVVSHPMYISGRMFAYLFGLKEPKFVVGYGAPDLDIALEPARSMRDQTARIPFCSEIARPWKKDNFVFTPPSLSRKVNPTRSLPSFRSWIALPETTRSDNC